MKLHRWIFASVFAVSLVLLAITGCSPSVKCDRQCLADLMQQYVVALGNNDPEGLPFADDVKFTENSTEGVDKLAIGEGLWENATGGPTDFQIYAADPEAQAAACLVVMKEKDDEGDKDIILGARIKLEEGKITEAEHMVARSGMGRTPFSEMETMQEARPGFAEDIPEAERMSREELIKIGLSYYDALTSEDGTRAPFSSKCERIENGNITAGGTPPKPKAKQEGAMPTGGFGGIPRDCEGQLSAGVFSYITEIKPRMVLADVQKGISVGFSMFRHDGTRRLAEDAEPGTDNQTQWGQFNLAAVHFYKIRNGQLYEIEAPGAMLPYGVTSGWESEEVVYPVPE